jgi:hypothetical protein
MLGAAPDRLQQITLFRTCRKGRSGSRHLMTAEQAVGSLPCAYRKDPLVAPVLLCDF